MNYNPLVPKTYRYELVHNESEESEHGEFGQWLYEDNGILIAYSFQEFVNKLFEKYIHQFNEILDWDCNDEETSGTVSYANSVDGMTLRFDVVAA